MTSHDASATLHLCRIGEECDLDYELHYAQCGAAVLTCKEHADGSLWVDNDEYSSRVNFCPFCGFKARQPIVFDALEEQR